MRKRERGGGERKRLEYMRKKRECESDSVRRDIITEREGENDREKECLI